MKTLTFGCTCLQLTSEKQGGVGFGIDPSSEGEIPKFPPLPYGRVAAKIVSVSLHPSPPLLTHLGTSIVCGFSLWIHFSVGGRCGRLLSGVKSVMEGIRANMALECNTRRILPCHFFLLSLRGGELEGRGGYHSIPITLVRTTSQTLFLFLGELIILFP